MTMKQAPAVAPPKHPQEYVSFVLDLVREYVGYPHDLVASAEPTKYGFKILLKGNAEDMGKLIGKAGVNISSLKGLVGEAAKNRQHGHGDVFVLEPSNAFPNASASPFEANPDWEGWHKMEVLLKETIQFVYPLATVTVETNRIGSAESELLASTSIGMSLLVERSLSKLFEAIGGQNGRRLAIKFK